MLRNREMRIYFSQFRVNISSVYFNIVGFAFHDRVKQ